MKKLLALLLFMVFVLTSCEFSKDIFNKLSQSARDYALNSDFDFIEKKAELLMTSIKNEDLSGIKNMFSQKAKSCDSDLDESIQLLISIVNQDFDGWVGSVGGASISKSYGTKKSIINYLFKNAHLDYIIWMYYYRTHTEDSSEIGLIALRIRSNDEVFPSNTLYWTDSIDSSEYGIYITEQVLADLENKSISKESNLPSCSPLKDETLVTRFMFGMVRISLRMWMVVMWLYTLEAQILFMPMMEISFTITLMHMEM